MALTEKTRRAKSRLIKRALDEALYHAAAIHHEAYDENGGFDGPEATAVGMVVSAVSQAQETLKWYEAWMRQQSGLTTPDE